MNRIVFAILLSLAAALFVFAQDRKTDKKSIAAFTEKLQKIDGFVPLYLDNESGKIYIEIARFNQEFLYQVSLPTGVGSNPLGLDRGQLGATYVVRFERAGNKILMVQPNYDFRALGENNAAERRSVEESFARSVIWGFKVEASEGERVLVDATSFFIRDAHGVADRFRDAKQGNYSLDESRSALYLPNTKGFPKNTEVEATITLTSNSDDGRLITAPTTRAVTVRERHSLVELPDDKYRPRKFDPRVGFFPVSFYDYSTNINEELEKRWITRYRLEKKDPNAAVSEAVKPIVYYVDNGAPKDVRDALIEGASWWNQAFEAAGYRNAFQVKVLPEGADPMDVRYNVINWVHRSTRGWSIGSSITDPRTGEIIRGVVTLDSQRARQDFLIGSGLEPQYDSTNGACDFAFAPDADYLMSDKPQTEVDKMLYARIRQLSAHEVGHTLGLAHNFAASSYDGRASVMDYPAPLVEIKNGKLDFSNAYAVGIGSYDKFAIRYGYAQFAAGADETGELKKIVREGVANGMLFISDNDTRPASAANPLSNLWDNGADAAAMLRREMQIRRIGLNQFGLQNIPKGAPLSELENKFLPLYLHHRYQLTAATKMLGGVYFTYAVRDDDDGAASPSPVQQIVSAQKQRDALAAILETIKPEELTISDDILKLIPPTAFGYDSNRSELFPKRTNPVFDELGAAEIAADLAISGLLEPNRAARMIDFNARDRNNPPFGEVVAALIKAAWKTPATADAKQIAVARAVQTLTVTRLTDLAASQNANAQARATAIDALRSLQAMLKQSIPAATNAAAAATAAHYRATLDDIERFLARPSDAPRKPTAPLPNPPGDPIGGN